MVKHHRRSRAVNRRGSRIEQAIHGVLKNLGFIIVLWATISNPLPAIAFVTLGPSIYLTIKTFSWLVFLPLFVRLYVHRENGVPLTLVLLAFRFATTSVYDPCIAVSLGDRDSCIMESLIIAAAGTIGMLALIFWVAIPECCRYTFLIAVYGYFISTVEDFSWFYMAHILSLLIPCVVFVVFFLDMLHAFGFLDDRVYNQFELVKSEVGHYFFPSFLTICSFHAIVTALLENLKGTLL